ncbi:DUF2911 domain-containing protein [Flavitalea sp.]|nr:DUF2911 domain-containing protein [Flavitalea sp.]
MKQKSLYLGWIKVVVFCFLIAACNQSENTLPNNKITVTPPPTKLQQDADGVSLDKSPMDMSYYPVDFSKQKMVKAIQEPLIARVIYSRPKKDNRLIFGDVVKYGSPWRLGANEATEIEFFTDVRINNETVKQGRYILYSIPYPDKWRIVLNNDLYTWGLKFDSTKDVHRFTVPIQKTNIPFERFTMEFEKDPQSAKTIHKMVMHIAWDSLYASLPISY